MPRFDRHGRLPLVTVDRNAREVRVDKWPHETEDPAEIEALLACGAAELPKPVPVAASTPERQEPPKEARKRLKGGEPE